jgi:hypothetical protein
VVTAAGPKFRTYTCTVQELVKVTLSCKGELAPIIEGRDIVVRDAPERKAPVTSCEGDEKDGQRSCACERCLPCHMSAFGSQAVDEGVVDAKDNAGCITHFVGG